VAQLLLPAHVLAGQVSQVRVLQTLQAAQALVGVHGQGAPAEGSQARQHRHQLQSFKHRLKSVAATGSGTLVAYMLTSSHNSTATTHEAQQELDLFFLRDDMHADSG
jgi:hypothetical protein